MTERTILAAGDQAPEFALPDQDGVVHNLSGLRGEKVILFFYPEAMTPGCSIEACDFQESTGALTAAGYRVFGISRDEVEKQRRFAERDGLEYPLLSDPDLAVHHAYGAFGEKNSYGKIVQGVIRSTFIIDKNGIITNALYNVKATGHVGRIRKLVGLGAA
ncbi:MULTISPECIES: thioredoxin-dependent thiol peroxidase [unclassified Leucobacter]|uniref:thioredoxin-dependent thiol peroxidase n=1 Tax=unclassified Leucobacter TaxID=2621730 RepID=UPI00165EB250|nr:MULTISPECIES: thioredoxin-dependent thiol peroxidase [unclassified Leucobacter]MBC9937151.1 thioredoxin-dependent thiol peroxidase [Leucobacter sp. cx-87]